MFKMINTDKSKKILKTTQNDKSLLILASSPYSVYDHKNSSDMIHVNVWIAYK